MNQPQPNNHTPRAPLDLWTITATEFFNLIESFKKIAASLDLSLTFVGQLCTVEGHVFQLVVGDAKPAYPSRPFATPPRSLAYANAGMLMADAVRKLQLVSASRILRQTDGTSRWSVILPHGLEVVAWVKPQTENEPEKPAEPAQEGGEGTDSAPTPETPPCGQPGEESTPPESEVATVKDPYRELAARMLSKPPEDVTEVEREIAKFASHWPRVHGQEVTLDDWMNATTTLALQASATATYANTPTAPPEPGKVAAGKTPPAFPAFLMDSPNDSTVIRSSECWRAALEENRDTERETLAATEKWMLTALKSPDLAEVFIEGGGMETELVPEFGFTDKHSDPYTIRDYFSEHGIPLVPQPDENAAEGESQESEEVIWASFSFSYRSHTPPIGEFVLVSEHWEEVKSAITNVPPAEVERHLLTAREYSGSNKNYSPMNDPDFGFGEQFQGARTLREFFVANGMPVPPEPDGNGGGGEPTPPPPSPPSSDEKFAALASLEGNAIAEGSTVETIAGTAPPNPPENFAAAGKSTPDIFTQAAATLTNKPVEEVTSKERDAVHTLIRSIPCTPVRSPFDANPTSGDSHPPSTATDTGENTAAPKQSKEIANPNHSPKEMQSLQTVQTEGEGTTLLPYQPRDVASGINFHNTFPHHSPTVSGCTVLAGIGASTGIDTGDEPSRTLYGILRERDKAQVLAAAKLGEDAKRVVAPNGAFRAAFTPKTRDPYQRDTPATKPNDPAHNPLSEPALLANSIIEDAFRQGPEAVAALKHVLNKWQTDFARLKGRADAVDATIAASAVILLSHPRPVPEEPAALTHAEFSEDIEQTAAEAFAALQPIYAGDRVALTKQIDNVYGVLPVGTEGFVICKVGGSMVMVAFDEVPFQQSVSIDRLRRLPPPAPASTPPKFAVGDRVAITKDFEPDPDWFIAAGSAGIVVNLTEAGQLVKFDLHDGGWAEVPTNLLAKILPPPTPSVNPDWTEAEREAIARLAKDKDMSPQGVLRQSLRTYQMLHHARLNPDGPDGKAWRDLDLPAPLSPKPNA